MLQHIQGCTHSLPFAKAFSFPNPHSPPSLSSIEALFLSPLPNLPPFFPVTLKLFLSLLFVIAHLGVHFLFPLCRSSFSFLGHCSLLLSLLLKLFSFPSTKSPFFSLLGVEALYISPFYHNNMAVCFLSPLCQSSFSQLY